MDRRTFLSSAAAFAGLTATPFTATASGQPARSGASTWRIPAEFEPTRAVWLSYDSDPGFSAVTMRMATALHPYVDLVIVAEDQGDLSKARSAAAAAGLGDRITYLHHEASRYFIRDYILFSVGPKQLGVVDFQFNTYGLPGWCANYLYPDDEKRAQQCAAFVDTQAGDFDRWVGRQKAAAIYITPLYLEGGAIEVNGKGTLLVSEPLALQRNAGLTRGQIEAHFLQLPGVRKVVWLAEGVAEDPHMKATITGDYIGWGAGFHTDEFVRFASPDTILLAWVEPQGHTLYPVEAITAERMHRNHAILSKATDQDGRPFKIIKVPMPAPMERTVILQESAKDMATWTASGFPASEGRKPGDRLTHVAAASYMNYIVANRLVLLPSYTEHGTSPAVQEQVRSIFASAFPGRDIKFIDVARLNWVGGGIHCATCNEPAVS